MLNEKIIRTNRQVDFYSKNPIDPREKEKVKTKEENQKEIDYYTKKIEGFYIKRIVVHKQTNGNISGCSVSVLRSDMGFDSDYAENYKIFTDYKEVFSVAKLFDEKSNERTFFFIQEIRDVNNLDSEGNLKDNKDKHEEN